MNTIVCSIGLCHHRAGASDTFTQHLLDIYDAAADSPFKAAASVGVWRSDYMLHAGTEHAVLVFS